MVSVPIDTPDHIMEFYNQLFRLAVQTPDSVKRFQDLAVITTDLTIKQVSEVLEQELATMRANQQFAPKQ
jgi:tripartite-type tricarboxylate transporter receptor subunit TctC